MRRAILAAALLTMHFDVLGMAPEVAQSPVRDTRSIERLKRDLAVDPSDGELWLALGWRLYRNGRIAEAQLALQEASALRPDDVYALWLGGLADDAMGDESRAHEKLLKVYSYRGRYPRGVRPEITHNVLGRYATERGDLLSAAIHYSKAMEHAPKDWRFPQGYAFVEWLRGNLWSAWEASARARTLAPREPKVLALYAHIVAALQERHGSAPEAPGWPAVTTALRQATAVDPVSDELQVLLGQVLRIQGDITNSERAYRRALDLRPDSTAARYHLARLLLERGDAAANLEAEALLEAAMADVPWFWVGGETAPHAKVLAAYLIGAGRLHEAKAVMAWRARVIADLEREAGEREAGQHR